MSGGTTSSKHRVPRSGTSRGEGTFVLKHIVIINVVKISFLDAVDRLNIHVCSTIKVNKIPLTAENICICISLFPKLLFFLVFVW